MTAKPARSLLTRGLVLAACVLLAGTVGIHAGATTPEPASTSEIHGKPTIHLSEKFSRSVGGCAGGVAWSPDASALAVDGGKDDPFVFDDSGRQISHFRPIGNGAAYMYSLGFVKGASQLVLPTSDYSDGGVLDVRDVATGQLITKMKGTNSTAPIYAVSPDQKRVAFRDEMMSKIVTYDTQSWKVLSSIRVAHPHDGFDSLAFFPDSKRLAVGKSDFTSDATADVIDSTSGEIVRELPVHSPKSRYTSINAIAVSPQGDLLLAGMSDGTFRVLNANDGTPTAILSEPDNSVRLGQAAWDPKDRFVAYADGRSLVVWQPKLAGENYTRLRFTSHPRRTFVLSVGRMVTIDPGDACAVLLSVAPDGKSLAVAHHQNVTVFSIEEQSL
jgi:WD40 repeat protein